jgi:hypothetical protein
VIRPLHFPDPERLVMIWERPPEIDHNNVVQTQNFLEWRRRNRSFEDIAAVLEIGINVESGSEVAQVAGVRVTAGFFERYLGLGLWSAILSFVVDE